MRLLFLVTLPLYLLDQLTKHLVLARIEFHGLVPVIPGFFNLTHTYNTGMAFGLMRDNNLFFVGLSFAALGVLAWLALTGRFSPGWNRAGALLLAAGVMGNLTDRILHGHVVDFLDFTIGSFSWPAFNVADSCICAAAGCFLIGAFREPAPSGGGAAHNAGDAGRGE